MSPKNKFIQLWLIIGILAGFSAIIFFIISYLTKTVLCDMCDKVKSQVIISLILSSLFGMFIGSLTYYFISEKYERKIIQIHKDVSATYKFLEPDLRLILKSLIEEKGEITQSFLVKKTGFSRVKISRYLKQLKQKNIIEISKDGMTNKVILAKDLQELLLK